MFTISIIIVFCAALLSLVLGFILNLSIKNQLEGNKKTIDSAKAVLLEVKKSLGKQNTALAAMTALVFVIILYLLNWTTAIGFLIGSIATVVMSFVYANIIARNSGRVVEASRKGSKTSANVALKTGAVAGLLTYGVALLVTAGFYAIFKDTQSLIGLAFGICLVALFIQFSGKGDLETICMDSRFRGNDKEGCGNDGEGCGNDKEGIRTNTSISFFELIALSTVVTMVLGQAMFKDATNAILFPIVLVSASATAFAMASIFTRYFKNTKNFFTVLCCTLTIQTLLFAVATFFVFSWLMKDIGILSMVNFYGLAVISNIVLFLAGIAILLNIYNQIVKSATLIAQKSEMPEDAINHLTSMGRYENISRKILALYSIKVNALISLAIFAGYYKSIFKIEKAFSLDLGNYLVLMGLFIGAILVLVFYWQKIKFNFESTNKSILLCSIIVLLPVIIGLVLGPVALGGFVIGVLLTGLFAAVFHSQFFANIVRISAIIALLIASSIV